MCYEPKVINNKLIVCNNLGGVSFPDLHSKITLVLPYLLMYLVSWKGTMCTCIIMPNIYTTGVTCLDKKKSGHIVDTFEHAQVWWHRPKHCVEI